jgi:hypothetical protein
LVVTCDIKFREYLRSRNLGALRKGSVKKKGGIAALEKKSLFPDVWLGSSHLRCKCGEDQGTERKK